MKRKWLYLALLLLLILPLWAGFQTMASGARPLVKLAPAGALVYLEAKDFSSLLKDWNASPEKAAWLKSDNYQVFSRSRLFLRLGDAQKEFTAAAGLPADMNLLAQVAGKESAFAWYDIGKLEFLYITRGAPAGSSESLLGQNRSKFEVRSVGAQTFYLHRDPVSGRVAAFASVGDYLVLATREDLIAGALQLLAGENVRSLDSEPWWARPAALAGEPGDLRMALNLEALVASPYFRTYWVQRNVTDMKQYTAALCDLYRSGGEYREERILLRRSAPEVPKSAAGARAASELAAMAPSEAGLFRAAADPAVDDALAMLESRLLVPQPGGSEPRYRMAPASVKLAAANPEGAGDYETRIDQAPANRDAGQADEELRRLLQGAGLQAVVEVHATEAGADGVFVRSRAVIGLVAASEWRLAEVQSAMTAVLQRGLTAGQMGVTWKNNRAGYAELDGLLPLAVAVRGKQVFIGNDAALLMTMLGSPQRKPEVADASYLAGFSHGRERDNFLRLSRVVDRGVQSAANPAPATPEGGMAEAGREPAFLSGNIGSLSGSLAGVTRERITVRDQGETVRQSVVYSWATQ
jgi:hypothetical protein